MTIIADIVADIVQGNVRSIVGGVGVNNDFVMVFATTGAAETVTIPCQNVGTFNATINWGDGTADSDITTYNDADLAHEYAAAGDHTVTISGVFPNIYFNNGGDKSKLKRILNWGDTGFIQLDGAFWGCDNLTSVTSSTVNTASVTNMALMFVGCTSLTTLDVSGFNTAVVTNMSQMFNNCDLLTDLRIDLWDIESVTNFTDFMLNHIGLLTSRYDAVLIAWDAQNPVDSLSVHFGGSKFTGGGAAEAARTSLVDGDFWVITDAGQAP